MAKIDLKKSSGFAIFYDNDLLVMQDLVCPQSGNVDIETIRPQLLNEELSYPENFYSKFLKLDHDGILSNKNIRFNIYVIPANLAGIEYVKTRAMRLTRHPKIIEVLYGGGAVVMQKIDGNSEDAIIAKVKKDQKVIVPPGYASSIVNTRQSVMIVSEIYSDQLKQNAVLDEMRGMAYYIIRKNAKQEIVRNPKYKSAPTIRKIKWEKILSDSNITLRTPIIKQILRKYEKFKWLFEENSITI